MPPVAEELVTATRALDRLLRWGHYVIPNWHISYDRIAYWDRFGQPAVIPDNGIILDAWWIDAERNAALEAGVEARSN